MKFKISIVTPTFNSEKYLEETILSVINQNYPNLEYIIIDGGSTDGTIDIIKKYEKCLSYWISEPDNGMYDAIQKGFNKATGEIMAWINSDDKYHPNAFNIVSEIFESIQEINWIVGQPSFYNNKGICVKISPPNRWSDIKFYVGNYQWLQQENCFWRKKLWEQSGSEFSKEYKYANDFELWCKFFKYSKLYTINIPLAGFRIHNDQISKIFEKKYLDESSKIINYFKINFPKKSSFFILSKIYKINVSLLKSKFIFIRKIGLQFNQILNKLYKLPPLIYYDFNVNRWKI
jgi:glycosyltransferase involved in cell wall biosynthesis